MTEVRSDPFAIDAAWLTNVLEDAGVARGAKVLDVELVTFVGTGQMGRNVRFSITWENAEGRPATVVGKFPTDDPTARATGFENGSYLREYVFYSELRPTVDIRTPDVWVALYDAEVPDFVFLMEDLKESAQGDQMRGLTLDEAALGVEQAVALHGPRWGDETLLGLLGGPREEAAERLEMIYAATAEGTLARLGHRVDDDVIALVRDLAPLVGRWAMGTDTPSTLVHMDFRPDNFLFAAAPAAPPLVVVDWQTISYGLGTCDVAYMIGGGFEAEPRARVERDLVDDYCRRLNAAGVSYDADACWRDYRLSSLWGVVMSVIATMLAEETERGNEMLTTMLRRHARHALDLDAIGMLR